MALRFMLTLALGLVFISTGHAQVQVKNRTDSLGDPLPEGALARLGTLRLKHDPGLGGTVAAAFFSPDGNKLVSMGNPIAGRSGVHIWEVATGKDLPGPWSGKQDFYSNAFALSPNGATLAAATFGSDVVNRGERSIVLWDVAAAKPLKSFPAQREAVTALVFADGGKTLVSAGGGMVRWWGAESGKEDRSWQIALDDQKKAAAAGGKVKAPNYTYAFSPDAKYLAVQVRGAATVTPEGTLVQGVAETIAFDLASGKVQWRVKAQTTAGLKGKQANSPQRLAFSGDGKWVAMTAGPDKVELRNAVSGKLIAMPTFDPKEFNPNLIAGLALSSDGSTLAIAGRNEGQLVLWSPSDPTTIRKLSRRMAGPSSRSSYNVNVVQFQPVNSFAQQCLTFSADNKTLLAGAGADLQLYDVATLKEIMPWEGHRGSVESVAFSADGKKLLTGTALMNLAPTELVKWDAATWKFQEISSLRAQPNVGVVTSADHSIYVGQSGQERFNLYTMADSKLIGRFAVPTRQGGVPQSFFSPDGKFYVLAGQDEKGKPIERLYAVPSCKLLCQLPPMAIELMYEGRPISFSADGKLVALVGRLDGLISVVETATGKLRHQLGTKFPVDEDDFFYFPAAIAFSPDGRSLASWNMLDDVIRVWDMATGKTRLQIFPTDSGNPQMMPGQFRNNAVHFGWSPDGRMLALGGYAERGKIQVWEVATRKIRREIVGHEGEIRDLAFSPDGHVLASASTDTTVLIWDVWGK